MTAPGANAKIIVLSDLHLGRRGQAVNGLDPAERLRLAVETILRDHADAAAVLVAGDIADQGETEAYVQLREMMAALPMPVHLTLGNHDNREAFLAVWGAERDDAEGRVSAAIEAGGHLIVLLDTSEPDLVGGRLCAGRKAWLGARLEGAGGLPVIIVMHHHAAPLSLPVDGIALEEAGDFARMVASHGSVRLVLSGHVHIASSAVWHGVPFVTMAGSHYSVSPHVPGMPGEQAALEGPAQMAVLLAGPSGVTVHFHDYVQRHVALARGLFDW
jgi:3',5'-cyclic AMP phosphodiesterase CpdA